MIVFLYKEATKKINWLQTYFKCCGINEITDWKYNAKSRFRNGSLVTQSFPHSCCMKKKLSEECGANLLPNDVKNTIHLDNCLDKYMEINNNAFTFIIGTYIFSAVGCLAVIFVIEFYLFKLRHIHFITIEIKY